MKRMKFDDMDQPQREPVRNSPVYECTTDRTKKLYTSPHYTDHRFDEPRTVFGAEADGLSYDYSDRFMMWDAQKHDEARTAATEAGHTVCSANWYEAYLSHFFGKSVRLEHVLAGVNRANGYPYAAFGYREVAE